MSIASAWVSFTTHWISPPLRPAAGLEPSKKLWSGELRSNDIQRTIFASFRGTIDNKGGKSYSRGLRIVMQKNLRWCPKQTRRHPSRFSFAGCPWRD